MYYYLLLVTMSRDGIFSIVQMKKLRISEGKSLVWGHPTTQWIQIWTQIWPYEMLLHWAHIAHSTHCSNAFYYKNQSLSTGGLSLPTVEQVRSSRSIEQALEAALMQWQMGVGGYIPQLPHLLVQVLWGMFHPFLILLPLSSIFTSCDHLPQKTCT